MAVIGLTPGLCPEDGRSRLGRRWSPERASGGSCADVADRPRRRARPADHRRGGHRSPRGAGPPGPSTAPSTGSSATSSATWSPATRTCVGHPAGPALPLRRRPGRAARGRDRPGVPAPQRAPVDPLHGGRRAQPPAPAGRAGVHAEGRRPAAARSCARSSNELVDAVAAHGPLRPRRRHLRAVPDPDHLRAARRAEGGLEAVQPLGHRHAAHLQRRPRRGRCRSSCGAGRARRVLARADRRAPLASRPTTCSPT